MGEWSEYFEDFPEENPANWIDGQFLPHTAAKRREVQERMNAKVSSDQAKLDAEIRRIIEKHKR